MPRLALIGPHANDTEIVLGGYHGTPIAGDGEKFSAPTALATA